MNGVVVVVGNEFQIKGAKFETAVCLRADTENSLFH